MVSELDEMDDLTENRGRFMYTYRGGMKGNNGTRALIVSRDRTHSVCCSENDVSWMIRTPVCGCLSTISGS